MKQVLTYSALNCFRNCPRKFKHATSTNCGVRKTGSPGLRLDDSRALELWYSLAPEGERLLSVLDVLDRAFPNRAGDPAVKAAWQLARAMLVG